VVIPGRCGLGGVAVWTFLGANPWLVPVLALVLAGLFSLLRLLVRAALYVWTVRRLNPRHARFNAYGFAVGPPGDEPPDGSPPELPTSAPG
jgi:hypothetical protein